jgi:hypothetical protein
MGGVGSGKRRRKCEKELTADYRRLDIQLWARRGLLYRGNEFGGSDGLTGLGLSLRVKVYLDFIVLTDLNADPMSASRETVIDLERTACRFGGRRTWFRCPRAGCGRRVAVLFVAGEVMCRKCAGLKYESQYRSCFDRNLRNCQMIRLRLGGTANLLKPFPPRPKGMRLARYLRLWDQASRAESFCWSALSKKLSKL